MRFLRLTLFAIFSLVSIPQADADNTAGRTPYMGWSSWSLQATTFPGYGGGSNWQRWLTGAHVKAEADVLHAKLQSHGYVYVNINSGWNAGYDAYGRPLPDPQRFPEGIPDVARYVHHYGLKLGIYYNPGLSDELYKINPPILGTQDHIQDIAVTPRHPADGWGHGNKIDFSRPGAQAYINSLAALFTSWGVDFLKLDGVTPGSDHNDTSIDARPDVAAWRSALQRTGRPVWLELSWDIDGHYADWWRQYADGWRISGDVESYGPTLVTWESVARRFQAARCPTPLPGGGQGWNDLDSLDIGNGEMDGLSQVERQTAMSLWAIQSAPLYTGDDLTKLDDYGVQLLTNDEVIAVDQAGAPAALIIRGEQQIRYALNADGSVTLALFNLDGKSGTPLTVAWSELGLTGPARVRDLWSHSDLGTTTDSFHADLPPHGSRLLRLMPTHPVRPLYYQIVHQGDGLRLSVRDGSANDAAPLAVSTETGDQSLWRFLAAGDGWGILLNKKSGKIINIPGPTTNPGTPLIQYFDDGNANSRWQLAPTKDGFVTLLSRYDGLALSVQGTAVIQSPPGGAGQNWRMVPVP